MKFVEEIMGFIPFEKKVWLATPTMHGEELKYMTEAYETNWMSTVGANNKLYVRIHFKCLFQRHRVHIP